MLSLTGRRLSPWIAPRAFAPITFSAAVLPAPTKTARLSSVVTRELRTSSRDKFADAEDRQRELSSLSGWSEVQGGRDAICKTFTFGNFNEAFAFMTRAALVAEKMDHHPEWFNVYNRVDVTLLTHDLGGLSRKDIILAQRLDEFATPIPETRP